MSLSLAQVAETKAEPELVIEAQVILGREEVAEEHLINLDFRTGIVVRISFHELGTESRVLVPHPVDSLERIVFKLQDDYPESTRSLYPGKVLRISGHEFFVTWSRDSEFFRGLERVCLVVADYSNFFGPVKQIFSFLKEDLLS